MAFESTSGILCADGAADRVRNRGVHFHLVPATPNGVTKAVQSTMPHTVQGKVVPFPSFVLRPPTLSADIDCKTLNAAVHLEWLKGRGAAWVSGSPEVTYLKEHNVFQLFPPDPTMPLVTESGLAAALDTLEDAALDECVAKHLTEGGDDRLHLALESGVNKYHCPPRPVHEDTIVRGSCTCSPPSKAGFEAARVLLRQLWQDKVTFEDACEDVRARISIALGLRVPHEVLLHPSGSDAELIPLLVGAQRAAMLGCSGVVNVVVAAGEVGSGTAPAAAGRHFSKYTPCGSIVDSGAIVSDFPEETKVIEIKARLQDGSPVLNYDALVLEAIRSASEEQDRPFFIVHAVDGSKTGLRLPSHELLEVLQRQYSERLLIVLDACQCRSEPEELDWYLSRGGVVLVTASKFYGAPGFCGAVLVPDDACKLLADEVIAPAGLSDYITKHEVPPRLTKLYNALPSGPRNIGLLLRWTCGITEMDAFAAHGKVSKAAIHDWVQGVRALVCARRPQLELLGGECDELCTWCPTRAGGVNSVVSIKFLSSCGTQHIDAAMLKRMHKWLTMDASDLLPAHASGADRAAAALRCFVGQPVQLGAFGVLRLAIGAPLACNLATDVSQLHKVLQEDAKILDKMVVLAKYCSDM